MKIILAVVGKTTTPYIATGIAEYAKRLGFYVPFELLTIPDAKTTKGTIPAKQKQLEAQNLLQALDKGDHVVLLDERGRELSSVELARYLEKTMSAGFKRLVFIVGGPYGFSDEVYQRADGKISLSKMTFPHELARLVFTEQLYRAMTILNNEPYHHP